MTGVIATPAQKHPRILTRPDRSSIAYHQTPGRGIGVVFLHGLKSDMNGGKALHLEAHCQALGRPFLRFDQFGHGQSSGRFVDGTIGRWSEDTAAVLDALCEGPQILVGSSMGGWVMVRAALARPEKVVGLLGIAPAPDFTADILLHATEEQRNTLRTDGILYYDSTSSDGPYPLSTSFFDDGAANVVLKTPIPFAGPVRIVHGQKDKSVPWERSLQLANRLDSDNVVVTLIKAGDHRLSQPQDLDRMTRILDDLLACVD